MIFRMPSLGCIADDFTGGTDLANNLAKTGFRTIQTLGLPTPDLALTSVDAVVIALKSRTLPVNAAVEQSVAALDSLIQTSCRQFYFKYCSTFDSTAHGNIGPVIDALSAKLGIDFTIVCPAFPDTGRTVYRGHLFVHDALLNESGMENHPLTPMRDPNLLRVLASQTASAIGLLRFNQVRQGAAALREEMERLQAGGCRMAVVDVLENSDLQIIGEVAKNLRLLTGGSGLALFLAENFGLKKADAIQGKASPGTRAILAGSCSPATMRQLSRVSSLYPSRQIRVEEVLNDFTGTVDRVATWAVEQLSEAVPVVIYTSALPEQIRTAQAAYGIAQTGRAAEAALASLAVELVRRDVTQMIVAGGETSGSVLKALEIQSLTIGTEIAPGVPWTLASFGKKRLALALKSGNFGGDNFFIDAWQALP